MNRAWYYVVVWVLMVAATFVQVYIIESSSSATFKQVSIIVIAAAEAITAATYYQNLRYETRVLSFVPIVALLVVSSLMILSIAGGA